MPFKGTLIGRALHLLGSGGTKIIASVKSGNPTIEFFTGLPSETEPGHISVTGLDQPTDYGDVHIQGPELDNNPPAYIRLWADESGPNGKGIEVYSGINNALEWLSEPSPNNRVHWRVIQQAGLGAAELNIDAAGGDGVVLNGASFDFQGAMQLPQGDRILGIDGGEVSADTFGVNGMVNMPHNLGGGNKIIVVTRTATDTGWLNRYPSDDTSTTFRCQMTFHGGGHPAAGTNITCTYLGIVLG